MYNYEWSFYNYECISAATHHISDLIISHSTVEKPPSIPHPKGILTPSHINSPSTVGKTPSILNLKDVPIRLRANSYSTVGKTPSIPNPKDLPTPSHIDSHFNPSETHRWRWSFEYATEYNAKS